MNQRRLRPPSLHSRNPLQPSRSRVRPRCFTLQVRLRGELGPTCQILCSGLEDAVRFGQSEFPAFAERNPWIGLDSLQRQIWILLDPEIDGTES